MEGNEATIGVTAIALVVALILAWLLVQRSRSRFLDSSSGDTEKGKFEDLIKRLDNRSSRSNTTDGSSPENDNIRDTRARHD